MSIQLNPNTWNQSIPGVLSGTLIKVSSAAALTHIFYKSINPITTAMFVASHIFSRLTIRLISNLYAGSNNEESAAFRRVVLLASVILTGYVAINYLGFTVSSYAVYTLASNLCEIATEAAFGVGHLFLTGLQRRIC